MLGHGFLSVQLQREPDLGSQATLSPKFPECHLQMSPVPGLEGGGCWPANPGPGLDRLWIRKLRMRGRPGGDKHI